MGLIELEFNELLFRTITDLMLTAAPIPFPTLDTLGSDRLISGMAWSHTVLGLAPPGYAVPPGTLSARADLKIRHVSVAELDLNPHAFSETNAIGWLLLRPSLTRLHVDAIQIDVAGGAPHVFSPQLPVGFQRMDVSAAAGGLGALLGSSLVHTENVVTFRLVTDPTDDLLAPGANRLNEVPNGGNWLLRISGEVLASQLRDRLTASVSPPPAGTVVEDASSAAWTTVDTGLSPWGVFGSVGLKKEDACPGIFSVDISVAVEATLTFQVLENDKKLKIQLVVGSNVSDWDSFRCWAGTGGLGSIVLGAITHPLVGVAEAIASLAYVGEMIRIEAGSGVVGHGVGGDMTKVSSTSTSATYESVMNLPVPGMIRSGAVDGSGVVVASSVLALAADHRVVFSPDGGTLSGRWSGHYSCGNHEWEQTYDQEGVSISDEALVGGSHFATVPVTVWPATTTVTPSGQWAMEISTGPQVTAYVGITSPGDPSPGQSGRAYVHTSAGVRVFDIAAVTNRPELPAPGLLKAYELSCRKFLREWGAWMKLLWLVDPPPFDYGYPPVRQWLLAIGEVPEGTSLSVHTQRGDEQTSRAIDVTSSRRGSIELELVTDDETDLLVESEIDEAPTGTYFAQRWLLPVQSVELPGPPTALARTGGQIVCLAGGRLVTWDPPMTEVIEVPLDEIVGLIQDGRRILVWGAGGLHLVANGVMRQLSDQPIQSAARDESGVWLTMGDRIVSLREDRVVDLPDAVHDLRPEMVSAPPLSLRFRDGKVAAAYANQLILAVAGHTNGHPPTD
jgi:hypothetical protein